jgi:hypothetical protein
MATADRARFSEMAEAMSIPVGGVSNDLMEPSGRVMRITVLPALTDMLGSMDVEMEAFLA